MDERPASRCEICGDSLADHPCVACRRCGTVHHLDCFRWNGGCSVYGCGSLTGETTDPAGPRSAELVLPEAPRVPVSPAFLVGLLGLIAGAVLALSGVHAALTTIVLALMAVGLACTMGLMVRAHLLPSLLLLDPATRAIRRRWHLLLLGPRPSRPATDLTALQVNEIHLTRLRTFGWSVASIHLVDTSGHRHRLYDDRFTAPWRRPTPEDLAILADALGNVFDAPVRRITSWSQLAPFSTLARLAAALGFLAPVPPQPSLPPRPAPALETGKQGKPSRAVTPRSCPACSGILTTPVTACSRCHAVVHEACWESARGCPIPGCEGRTGTVPTPPTDVREPFEVSVRHHPQDVALHPLTAVSVIGAFLAFAALLVVTPGRGAPLGPALSILGPVVFGSFFAAVLAAVGSGLLRTTYSFDPSTGCVDRRRYLLGMRVTGPDTVFTSRDMVEVYQRTYTRLLIPYREITVGLRDGRLVPVYRWMPPSNIVQVMETDPVGDDEVGVYAERAARFGGCSVRYLRDGPLPAAEELRCLPPSPEPSSSGEDGTPPTSA